MGDHTPGQGPGARLETWRVQTSVTTPAGGGPMVTTCHTSHLMMATLLQRLTCDMEQWRSDHSLVTLTQGQVPHTVEAVHIGL